MEYVAIVTALLLLQLLYFAVNVGQMRVRHGVKAPACEGPEEFMRAFRVHENSVEQIVMVVPAMWMFAYFLNPMVAAALGLLFLFGRFWYRSGYLKDPLARGKGFATGILATVVLILGSLVGAVLKLL